MNEETIKIEAGEMKDKTEIELEKEIEALDKEHSVIHHLYYNGESALEEKKLELFKYRMRDIKVGDYIVRVEDESPYDGSLYYGIGKILSIDDRWYEIQHPDKTNCNIETIIRKSNEKEFKDYLDGKEIKP